MFIRNEDAKSIIKGVLVSEGISDPDTLTQKVMDELVKWQQSVALKGSKKGGRPEKKINFDTVRKQLAAGIDMTTIAASQKVSEGTLRRRMKEES